MSLQTQTSDRAIEAGPVDLAPTPVKRRPWSSPLSPRVVWSVADQVFVSGMSFGTSILVGRIDATSLGVYALAMTLVNFYRSIQAEAVTAPFTVYAQKCDTHTLSSYSGSVVVHQVAAMLLGVGVVIMALATAWSMGAPGYLQRTLWVLVLAMPTLLWHSFARQYCFARFRFARATVIDGTVAMLQISLLAWLAATGRMTVERSFLVMAGAAGVGVLVWLLGRDERFRFDRGAIAADWFRNWGFAKWALASQLIGCSTPYILPWVISFTRGEHDTGLFAACVTTMGLSMVFISALSNVLTPVSARRYATGGVPSLLRVLWRAVLAFVTIVGTFGVVIFLTGDMLVVWFYGDGYAGTGHICRWLAVGVLLNSLSIVAGNGLWAIDQPRWNLPADMAALGLTALAAVWLIPAHGILGAAFATVAGAGGGVLVRTFTLVARLGSVPAAHTSPERSAEGAV